MRPVVNGLLGIFANLSDSSSRESRGCEKLRQISMPQISKYCALCLFCLFCLVASSPIFAKSLIAPVPLPRLVVHPGQHYLQTEKGEPFFWLGDTAWELLHRTTREECSYYLRTRAVQGYTVIQTVVLAEMDGINSPNALGEKPFVNGDPSKPNEKYFARVVEVVDEAASRGLYVALLPTWGDKITAPWGVGPRIFRTDNLEVSHNYAAYLARLLKDRTNVVWILGGDRPPKIVDQANGSEDWIPIWRSIAAGIRDGLQREPFIVYHPQGGVNSSSSYLQNEGWLTVNGMQSGHGHRDTPVWDWIERDYKLVPTKPTLDLEPNYEDHPMNPWPRWDPAQGYFRDFDVRKQIYRSVFAGACGVTYGHHAVWQFAGPRYEPINFPDRSWMEALLRPGANQVGFLRNLMLSRPFFARVPDQTLVLHQVSEDAALHVQATRDLKSTYAFVYFPISGLTVHLNLTSMSGRHLRAWWYDPRTGTGTIFAEFDATPERAFESPQNGQDWILVLDDVSARYGPPGLI